MPNAFTLQPLALVPLPLGSVRPAGWLERQLRIQADGLSGHLDEFWNDIQNSGWIGGTAEGWERGPYWLDGLVPLAFLLDDERLKGKVRRYIDYILDHQGADGWLGPEQPPGGKRHDPWPAFIMLKVFTQYHEATADPRIIPAMTRLLRCIDADLDAQPLFDWGKSRWADAALSVYWLYERTREDWLLRLAAKLRAQGYDWIGHFADFQFKQKTPGAQCGMNTHVVNNAMAVKAPGICYRLSGDPGDRDALARQLETLDTYHGQVTGVFSGDEHYAGKMPSQGTELCAVVEYMFSLEMLLSILGDAALADRLERIAFNAFPATFSPDMWAHQYDQQANQVMCRVSPDRVFETNGPDANLFGLEPNYGCCTANLHQGWPKLASHLWMKTSDGGLAAVVLAPCRVETTVDGKPVTVEVETDYPFGEIVTIKVTAKAPATFPLDIRIPAWADGATMNVGGQSAIAVPGRFCRISGEWRGTKTITLRLPMSVRTERRYNNAISIHRGPLVYSLKVGEYWKQLRGEQPHADWEVYPTTPWNVALHIDESAPAESVSFESGPVGACPFSPDGAPVQAKVRGRLLPDWVIEKNAAAPPPPSPVCSTQPDVDLTLIPYGCTNLRVTEFPVLG